MPAIFCCAPFYWFDGWVPPATTVHLHTCCQPLADVTALQRRLRAHLPAPPRTTGSCCIITLRTCRALDDMLLPAVIPAHTAAFLRTFLVPARFLRRAGCGLLMFCTCSTLSSRCAVFWFSNWILRFFSLRRRTRACWVVHYACCFSLLHHTSPRCSTCCTCFRAPLRIAGSFAVILPPLDRGLRHAARCRHCACFAGFTSSRTASRAGHAPSLKPVHCLGPARGPITAPRRSTFSGFTTNHHRRRFTTFWRFRYDSWMDTHYATWDSFPALLTHPFTVFCCLVPAFCGFYTAPAHTA